MTKFLDKEKCQYFFGDQFDTEAAEEVIINIPIFPKLSEEIQACIQSQRPHMGFTLVCFLNLDTGIFCAISKKSTNEPSMISFYIESHHRFFGGSSLTCVPLLFCTELFSPHSEYLVYRHTYKEPKFTQSKIDELMKSSSPEQKAKLYTFIKSRIGYQTIPGMSYVGLTKRSWQKLFREHVEDAFENGSSRKFHEAMRSMQGHKAILVHDISAFGLTQSQAKTYEKELITKTSKFPNGLNMKA